MVKKLGLTLLAFLLATAGLFSIASHEVYAANAADWRAGRIIDDGVFANRDSMSVEYIQNFLNQKVGTERGNPYSVAGVCDTNGTKTSEYGGGTRAQYGAANGNPAPFTCLKDYYEVPKIDPGPGIPASNYGGAPIPAGAKSAAQIIWDAAQRYSINPKVLLVLIQKESAGPLITDDWPFRSQYTYAMGAHCPDTAPCDENYAGFSMQVHESARLFRYYITNMNQPWWPYKKPGINSILYNPNASCGSSNVNIETYATAALYTYTPYQPNQAALNNLYGSAPPCGAYGNRNFWRYFIDWFGSTQTEVAYGWLFQGQATHQDSARTQPFTSTATVAPNAKLYVKIRAMNIGSQPWYQNVRIGTSNPRDRSSPFYDTSWINTGRPAQLLESSITPGQTGTFEFALKAPSTPGTYKEYFNIVIDGATWFNDPGQHFTINVVSPVSPYNSINTGLSPGANIKPGEYLLSPDTQSVLTLQKDGNIVLYSDFSRAVWSTSPQASPGRLEMQTDGNLVFYNTSNQPLWNSGTNGNPGARLDLQTDGNLVIYSSSNSPLWSTGTVHIPDNLSFVNTTLLPTGLMFPGQRLETADRRFKFIMQTDGNLVIYSPTRAIWSSGTWGKEVSNLVMQTDGNLVLYSKNGQPLWHSNTSGAGLSQLIMQADGNLVLYNSVQPTWHTHTAGAQ